MLGVNAASRVSGDDMSAAASQSHLDTDRESISTILRDDSFAEVGLGAQSSLVPEHVSGGVPASGSSSGGGKRQKQPKLNPVLSSRRSSRMPLRSEWYRVEYDLLWGLLTVLSPLFLIVPWRLCQFVLRLSLVFGCA